MSIKPALTELPIKTADSGFYRGFSQIVTICSKVLIGGLVVWAIAFPEQSGAVLNGVNSFILSSFGAWYIWTVTSVRPRLHRACHMAGRRPFETGPGQRCSRVFELSPGFP